MNKYLFILLLFFILFSIYQCDNNKHLKNKAASDAYMIEALTTEVEHTTDKYNRVVTQKKVIEASVKDLESANKILTTNQAKLLKEVKTAKKGKVAIQIEETVYVDSLAVTNDKTVIIEEVKKGTIVKVINSNPEFRTEEVDAIFIPTKKKWYNRKAFKIALFVAGVATGVALAK